MTEQEIREKWNKYCNKHWKANENGKIVLHVEEDFGYEFIDSIRTQEREELEKKINGMMRKHYNEEEPFLKHRNDYNDAYNQILLDIKALLKEQ